MDKSRINISKVLSPWSFVEVCDLEVMAHLDPFS